MQASASYHWSHAPGRINALQLALKCYSHITCTADCYSLSTLFG
jgi:hypothetical protein